MQTEASSIKSVYLVQIEYDQQMVDYVARIYMARI